MKLKQKLNSVLLIDDSTPTNVYHKKLIAKSGIAEKIDSTRNGKQGLEYLVTNDKFPDLILLDINMPDMDGWEFVSEFNMLPMALQKKTTVIMLSTSPNPRDKERALLMDAIMDYKVKPLSLDMLNEIMFEHFEENVEES